MKKEQNQTIESQQIRKAFLFGTTPTGKYNGFAIQSEKKLKNVLLFFIDRCNKLYESKMNKLLFYTDYYAYKTLGTALTGLSYEATNLGPVPFSATLLYCAFFKEIKTNTNYNGYISTTEIYSEEKPDYSVFSESEINVLNHVLSALGNLSAKKIISLDFQNDLWENCIGDENLIDFSYDLPLRAI